MVCLGSVAEADREATARALEAVGRAELLLATVHGTDGGTLPGRADLGASICEMPLPGHIWVLAWAHPDSYGAQRADQDLDIRSRGLGAVVPRVCEVVLAVDAAAGVALERQEVQLVARRHAAVGSASHLDLHPRRVS